MCVKGFRGIAVGGAMNRAFGPVELPERDVALSERGAGCGPVWSG
ncbi:hypothetical protein [Streptomyces sp. NPDC050546]